MRNLMLAAAFWSAMVPSAVALAAPSDAADYRLDIGDQLRIRVFEWRSATGDVHEWGALNGEYDIGADGSIAMPLLGAVKATGMTTAQLADAISSQLQSHLGLTIRPQASIAIAQYRPFYILGDVNKPGEYSYRPGLTVLEAIGIAGGRYRVNDPALVLNASGELRVYRLQYNQLLVRRARLRAELDDTATITLPPELQRQQNDPHIAQLIQREQAMLTAHRDALSSESNALNQLKTLLSDEVNSLQDKIKNMDQQLDLLKQQLNSTTTLVQRGLAIMPREFSLRQTELETEGRRLDLDTAMLRAKEDIGKADQAIVELRNKIRNKLEADLAEVEQRLPETAAHIATEMTIVDRETAAPANNDGAGSEDRPAVSVILRKSGGGARQQIQGDENAVIEPGDTIKVLRDPSAKIPPTADATPVVDTPAPADPAALARPPAVAGPNPLILANPLVAGSPTPPDQPLKKPVGSHRGNRPETK